MNKLSYLSILLVLVCQSAVAKKPLNTDINEIELQPALNYGPELALLSKDARERFIRSIQYNKRGQITSFYYGDIKKLKPAQAQKVLTTIGMRKHTHNLYSNKLTHNKLSIYMSGSGDFLEGYKCDSPGSCRQSLRYACTKNC